MASRSQSKTHNIFLLDKTKLEQAFFEGAPTAVDAVVSSLVTIANADDVHAKYEEQQLLETIDTDIFTVKLFFRADERPSSKLASFCKSFVEQGEEVLTFCPRTASTVLFVWSDKNLFAITTGQGFRLIDEYCVPKFGMLVVSRFEEKFRVTALDSNGMSSRIHSNKTIYSNEVDFVDVDALDIIFKEVTGRLNDEETVKNILQFGAKSKKDSVKITAKNYVQFSASLDFSKLIYALGIIDTYDFSILSDRFNLIVPISETRQKHDFEENKKETIKLLYEMVQERSPFIFDLFHKNTNDFIAADHYKIYHNGRFLYEAADIEPIDFLQAAYNEFCKTKEDTFVVFEEFAIYAEIRAMREDVCFTSGSLLKHISGEVCVNDKNYYIFYGSYYCLATHYTERLNQSLSGKLRDEYYVKDIRSEWLATEKEDDYNAKVSVEENYIHVHKVKPELIEFADLLKYEADQMTIVHVKDGFDGDMRALDRQVELSIARVLDIQHNGKTAYMEKLYDNACKNKPGRNIKDVFDTKESFVQAMKTAKIRYIIVLHPKNKDLLKNKSNIAKHCLNAMLLRCFEQGIELKINKV